jgi:hypothetical protein
MGFAIIKMFYMFIISTLLAIIEINIEGPNGWAANIPTWRPRPEKWYAKFFKNIVKKELIGYHLSLFTFLITFFHIGFFFGLEWSIARELDVICMFLIYAITWDYLWFVLNPHFSIKTFGKKNEFWHKKWFLKLPIEFSIATILSFGIATINDKYFNPGYLNEWFIVFFGLVILIGITRIIIKTFKPEWE